MKLSKAEIVTLITTLSSILSPAAFASTQISLYDGNLEAKTKIEIIRQFDNTSISNDSYTLLKGLILRGQLVFDPSSGHYILNTDITALFDQSRIQKIDASMGVVCGDGGPFAKEK